MALPEIRVLCNETSHSMEDNTTKFRKEGEGIDIQRCEITTFISIHGPTSLWSQHSMPPVMAPLCTLISYSLTFLNPHFSLNPLIHATVPYDLTFLCLFSVPYFSVPIHLPMPPPLCSPLLFKWARDKGTTSVPPRISKRQRAAFLCLLESLRIRFPFLTQTILSAETKPIQNAQLSQSSLG